MIAFSESLVQLILCPYLWSVKSFAHFEGLGFLRGMWLWCFKALSSP